MKSVPEPAELTVGVREHTCTRSFPLVDEVRALLERDQPEPGQPALVHGDFRLDNVVGKVAGPLGPVEGRGQRTPPLPQADRCSLTKA